MLKDLVVNLATDRSTDPTANFALSIAEAFGAQITGVAFALEPIIPAPVMGGIGSDIIETAIAENRRAAKAALDRFDATAKTRGLAAATRQYTAILAEATSDFGRIARCFDVSVVGQVDPGQRDAERSVYRGGAIRIGPPHGRGALYSEAAAQAWPGSLLLGRQRDGGARDCRRHALSAKGSKRGPSGHCHREDRYQKDQGRRDGRAPGPARIEAYTSPREEPQTSMSVMRSCPMQPTAMPTSW